jgi:hypothetical protein
MSTCVNLPGKYECKCAEGFEGDGFNCTDINECDLTRKANENDEENEESKSICNEVYFKCLNTLGGYECVCKEGFVQGGVADCIGKYE